MLSPAENERLTRVGPGTPMGDVFRRYWLPAALSSELPEPDGAPIRVRLLGEDLIAFRDSTGAVGLVSAYCPHRRAPMFFGRNEECGLRCVYHGWKFDRDGTCVDMPSEPPDSLFKTKVKIEAYPAWEGGGYVWTYMGPPDAAAAAARLRARARPRDASFRLEDVRERELAAGARRRDGHLAHPLPAQEERRRSHLHAELRSERSADRRLSDRLRLYVHRDPARRRPPVGARFPLPDAERADARRRRRVRPLARQGAEDRRPPLDPDRRRHDLGLQLHVCGRSRAADHPRLRDRLRVSRRPRPRRLRRELPVEEEPRQRLLDRPRRCRSTGRSPGSSGSTPRTSRCKRGWGRSSTVRRSTWERPTAR